MKFRIALLMLLTAAAFGIQASDEDNLIQNPDFKEQKKMWTVNSAATFENGIATVPLTTPRKNDPNIVTASISQRISAIKPGRYEFSGYYKGEFKNLYIVFRGYTKEKKSVNIIVKWLFAKDFVKASDKPGWNKFYYTGEVPADVVSASIHIEPWGGKGQSIQLTGLELAETE